LARMRAMSRMRAQIKGDVSVAQLSKCVQATAMLLSRYPKLRRRETLYCPPIE
jgi:hypothetical protein